MTFQDTAVKIASALQGTPMLLVLLILNAAVLGMVTWLTMEGAKMRTAERAELIKLLDHCMKRGG